EQLPATWPPSTTSACCRTCASGTPSASRSRSCASLRAPSSSAPAVWSTGRSAPRDVSPSPCRVDHGAAAAATARRACRASVARLSEGGHGVAVVACGGPLRRCLLAPLRRARLRLWTRVVEARLAARHRRDHLLTRQGTARGGPAQPVSGAGTPVPLAGAVARLPGLRRVRALRDGGDGAVGTPPAAAPADGGGTGAPDRGARGASRGHPPHGPLRLVGGGGPLRGGARPSGEPRHGPRAESHRAGVRARAPYPARGAGDVLRSLGVRCAAHPAGAAPR